MIYECLDLKNPIINTDVSEYRILKRICQMIPLRPDEIDKINNSVIFDHDEFQPRENHFLNVYSASELIDYSNSWKIILYILLYDKAFII